MHELQHSQRDSLSLESNMEVMEDLLDKWNQEFQMLNEECVVKMERANAWFEALVQRIQMVADQVEA